nr:uncharacterized protein LOC103421066 isoform X2 [Malus domestica]
MCQMSWHLQNRNNHQLRKQKLPQLRVQQPLLHLKLMLSQKGLKVRMPRLLKMEQHMIKMRTSQQKVLRTVHLPAVLLDDMDQESNKDHYFSGPGEFGLNPIRTGSSQGGGFSQSRPFTFDDSVPSTPLSAFNSGYSPPRYKDSSEPSFDTSRFDSFRSTQDTGFFPQPETLGRFDSMRSSRDFDQGNGFPTFDDIPDPFGSSAPFRSSLDSQTQRRDSDPFGSSGPFRTSLDSQTPRKESDFFGFSAAPFRTSLTVKLQEETRTHFGPLHLGHHSLQEETRTHLGLQGLSGRHWRLRKRL